MDETEAQFDPSRVDLITVAEDKGIYKLIIAAAHISAMGAADEDALRQKLANYIVIAASGELQGRYPELAAYSGVIQVDIAPDAPLALRQIPLGFSAEASSKGLSIRICEID
jgi:hypothetical protein